MRVVIASLLLSLAACGQSPIAAADKGKPAASQATAAIDRSHAGTAAPALSFEKRDGSRVSLADFRGTPVLVNLWATWCAPCKAEMPELNGLAESRGGKLAVLPISQDMEGWQAVDGFFTTDAFAALTPYLDQKSEFAQAVNAKGLPVSILYDAQGREVWRVAGPLKWDSVEVAKLIG